MTSRATLAPIFGLAALLTRCALSDHYVVSSTGPDQSGVARGGEGGVAANGGGAGAALTSAGASPAPACLDVMSDVANCGACGVHCDAGRECAAGTCRAGWTRMAGAPSGFAPRSRAAAVAVGKSVFIWGGAADDGSALANGALYSPVDDSWTLVAQAPSSFVPRIGPTAVWTGHVVIVFGGTDAAGMTVYNDAASYDPTSKTWAALPLAATRRNSPIGFWDGKRALFWGGTSASGSSLAGADRFDLAAWTASTLSGDPGGLMYTASAFDGATLYVQGGILGGTRQDNVYAYLPANDKWTDLGKAVSPRSGAFAAWDGLHFLVWGGRDDEALRGDGAYSTSTGWVAVGPSGAPMPRMTLARRTGWMFAPRPGVVALLGGQVALNGTLARDGAIYDTQKSEWRTIDAWGSGEDHESGVAVWTGDEFVLWSGRDEGSVTGAGERLAL